MSDYRSHLSITVWAALLVMVLGTILTLPERTTEFFVLGSPVRLTVSSSVLVALVALTVVCAGFDAALRTHPRPDLLQHSSRYWGLPAVSILTAVLGLHQVQDKTAWLFGLVATAGFLITVLWAEYHVVDREAPEFTRWHLVLNALALTVLSIALFSIYMLRMRSLLSAPLVGGIVMLVALDMLRDYAPSALDAHLYAGIIALLMAQATWLLNYAAFSAQNLSLALMLIFYILISWTLREWQGRPASRLLEVFVLLVVLGLTTALVF